MTRMKYTFIDTESWWDRDLHRAYQHLDPATEHRRIGCRRIGVAAALDVEIDEEGRISVGAIASWSAHDLGGEREVVIQLFDHPRQRDDRVVVTYGGIATDVQILTLAAMQYGLRLPPQLIDQPGRKGPRQHLDLALMLKSGGRTFHHLSEVALRIGIPLKLLEDKKWVDAPASTAAWEQVRAHCEKDCVITAYAMIAWRCAQGHDALRLEPGLLSLMGSVVRRKPDRPYAPLLRNLQAALQQDIVMALGEAA